MGDTSISESSSSQAATVGGSSSHHVLFNKVFSQLVSSLDSSLNSCSCSNNNKNNNNNDIRQRKVHFVVSRFTYIEPEEAFHPPLNFQDLFYTKEDFAQIKLETDLTVQLMEAKDPRLLKQLQEQQQHHDKNKNNRFNYDNNDDDDDDDDDEVFCTRGIEDLVPLEMQRRCNSTTHNLRAVLIEQARQHQNCISDVESLAETSRQLSLRDVVRAHHQGLLDAHEAAARETLSSLGINNDTDNNKNNNKNSEPKTNTCTNNEVKEKNYSTSSKEPTWMSDDESDLLSIYQEDGEGEQKEWNGDGLLRKISKESERDQKAFVLLAEKRPFSFQRFLQSKSCWCG